MYINQIQRTLCHQWLLWKLGPGGQDTPEIPWRTVTFKRKVERCWRQKNKHKRLPSSSNLSLTQFKDIFAGEQAPDEADSIRMLAETFSTDV